MKVSDDLKAKYDIQYTGGQSEWRDLTGKPKAERIIKLCAENGVKPANVLDVGCGEGSILKYLSERKFSQEYYAVDISQSGIDALKGRGLQNLVEARVFDGVALPYEDGQFELAICSHVLEHVEFERLLLREIGRVAKYAIVEVPIDFRPFADEKLEHFLGYGHINMYSPTTVRFLVKTEGFELVDDVIGTVVPEISCYNYFKLQKIEPDTEENVARRYSEISKIADDFYSKDRAHQEGNASEYAMLLKSRAKNISIF